MSFPIDPLKQSFFQSGLQKDKNEKLQKQLLELLIQQILANCKQSQEVQEDDDGSTVESKIQHIARQVASGQISLEEAMVEIIQIMQQSDLIENKKLMRGEETRSASSKLSDISTHLALFRAFLFTNAQISQSPSTQHPEYIQRLDVLVHDYERGSRTVSNVTVETNVLIHEINEQLPLDQRYPELNLDLFK